MNFSSFASALLDPARPCPQGLRTHSGSDPAVRFAVYRNNAITSLAAATADGFPVVRQLVGEEFFAAMARVFIARQPPRSPLLADWGDTFAAFIADFEPAATVPYLADIARLERARVRAFHAADAPSLEAGQIAAHLADPAALAGARPVLHPSVQIVASDFAIVSLWAAHHGDGDIAHVDPFVAEAALVLREDDDAAVVAVPRATAAFVQGLAQGNTLARAAACAGRRFDLAASLAVLIRHRALVEWRTRQEPGA